MALTQKHREIDVVTPLGADVLLLREMSGTERLGRPFQYQLDLASEDYQVKFDDIIGQPVTIRLEIAEGTQRYFNGYVSRFRQVKSSGRLAHYKATVVPWLWFLTRKTDCRIFQETSVPDIVKQVFRDLGFTDFEDTLKESYRTWEYCVQYRETDFNFVSRLMEQEGIYYFFRHEDERHVLVLADAASAHEPYRDYEQIKYHGPRQAVTEAEYISDWTVDVRVQPGFYALNAFDFKNTRRGLQVRTKVPREHSKSDYEVYDYPGEYVERNDGQDYARRRIEELQAQHEVVTAEADARGICTGCTFTLAEHPRQDQNRKYLITAANYAVNSGEFFSRDEVGTGCVYSCTFTAIDVQQPFRPPRVTAKPSIPGPQTAIVVGPSGEEIFTDEYGRVKVKFHWDRHNKADENSSCWIRVAQVWAGKRWGAMYVPRIGQEVIVEFLEGDPDRPIITGRVYNDQAMPPYDLPSNQTMSTLKSNSSKSGQGFNEIRFEDKKDEEQIFIHGQKNLDIRVRNDRFETVEHDRHLVVENEKFEQVKSHRNEFVEQNHLEEIGQDRNLTVKGKEAKEVGKSLSLTVKGDVIEVFKADHSEQTTGDYYLKGNNVVIEATQNITLSVGSSYIAIEPGTIEIKTGGQITVQGKRVGVNGDMMTEIKGGTTTQIQGGTVKIN